MRLGKIAIRIGVRVGACLIILFLMFAGIQYVLANYSGTYGYPEMGKGVLISLAIIIAGIVAMLFALLYKSSWTERDDR